MGAKEGGYGVRTVSAGVALIVRSDFAGMTVNERLYLAGLLAGFNNAVRTGDRTALIDLLAQVDLADQAPTIADAVLSRSDPGVLHRTDASPKKLNAAGREIWFKRVLWSYWPCHWKALMLGPLMAAVVVPIALLLAALFPSADWVVAIPIAAGGAFVIALTVRHLD